jgi:hypothetical protein
MPSNEKRDGWDTRDPNNPTLSAKCAEIRVGQPLSSFIDPSRQKAAAQDDRSENKQKSESKVD